MNLNIRKETDEDRFARHYYCNAYRFVHKMKRKNRKQFRQRNKKIVELERNEYALSED